MGIAAQHTHGEQRHQAAEAIQQASAKTPTCIAIRAAVPGTTKREQRSRRTEKMCARPRNADAHTRVRCPGAATGIRIYDPRLPSMASNPPSPRART